MPHPSAATVIWRQTRRPSEDGVIFLLTVHARAFSLRIRCTKIISQDRAGRRVVGRATLYSSVPPVHPCKVALLPKYMHIHADQGHLHATGSANKSQISHIGPILSTVHSTKLAAWRPMIRLARLTIPSSPHLELFHRLVVSDIQKRNVRRIRSRRR
jgi:hypothetical protein